MKHVAMHKEGCCCGGHGHHHETHVHHENCGCAQHVECACESHEHHESCCDHGCDVDDGEEHHKHSHQKECGCGSNHVHEHHHDGGTCELTHDHHDIVEKEMKKAAYKFSVSGLDCASCAMKVEKAIQEMDEIRDAVLSFSTSMLLVDTKEEDEEKLLQKINEIANKVEPGVSFSKFSREAKEESHAWEIGQIILGILLLLAGLLVKAEYSVYFLIASYAVAGYHVLWTAVRNVFKGDMFDENFLMSLATLGALYTGEVAEAVAVMLFYDIGELFQSIAVNRSRKSISDLMNIHSEYANVIRNGEEVKVSPEVLQAGDILVVRAGERIPVDGVIVSGTSSLDMSALNGESLPKDIMENDEVLAGSLNLNGVFQMRATKAVSESTVSRVLELVENASSKKAPIEKFITRFSKIYTPVVVLAALIMVIVPSLLWGDFNTWLYRGCTFLVISCPCALVVSIPLGLFAGIGAASKKGVLVKGGNYLELLSEIDTVVLDKTGTITKGSFALKKVIGSEAALELAAYGERYSNHPIAKSIVSAYGKNVDTSLLSDYKEIAGKGISVLYKGKTLLVGNAALLEAERVSYTVCEELGSLVYVAYDGVYEGCIVIADEIKETSKEALQRLKELGVKRSVMLTGDKEEIASYIAKEVGIDKVHAQLLPQDKVRVLETYLSDANKVAFVGDGINDAPVLMRADIGIAMGGIGSDAAIEASDVVLMNDDLLSISSAIHIAKKTKMILKQNIWFSLLVKFGILVLSAFGLANMWMGVFADVGVTLLAVMNAMRALLVK